MEKPIFNVVPPFQGLTTIQMNSSMAQTLADFIEYDRQAPMPIKVIAQKLRRPGTWSDRESKLMLSTDKLYGVTNLVINGRVAGLLVRYLQSCQGEEQVDVEIVALAKTLRNFKPKREEEDREERFNEEEETPSPVWNGV